MNLRAYTVTVTRPPTDFENVGGEIRPVGANTIFEVSASVHPASGNDLQSLPESRRQSSGYKLFTNTKLQTAKSGIRNADQVELYGDRYEVVRVEPWQNNVISHYKVLVVA